MKRLLTALTAIIIASGAFGRDFSAATRIDSIDRELSAAREQLAILDADYYRHSVWGLGRYTSIAFSLLGNTDLNGMPRDYSSFGIALNQGTTYLWPEGAGFGSFIKLGLDMRWVDLELTFYDKWHQQLEFNSSGALGNHSGISRYPDALSMRRMSFLAGICGVGPAISIAPFSWVNNGMASVKIQIYGHYLPSYGLLIYRGTPVDRDGNRMKNLNRGPWTTSMAYVHTFDCGFKLRWKRFAAGIEFRWATGRFPAETYRWTPAEPFPLTPDPHSRYRRTFSSTRLQFSYSL